MEILDGVTVRKYTNHDYPFAYEVKKNAYKKYVEKCWGAWIEEDQKKYFNLFITQVKEHAYIIQYNNKDIGFYNGEMLENGNYEIGNIIIIPEYQGKGIGTGILKGILEKYANYNIMLRYFKQNPASALYERCGFEKSGETDFHCHMMKPKSMKLANFD